jgi:hypothetical protein
MQCLGTTEIDRGALLFVQNIQRLEWSISLVNDLLRRRRSGDGAAAAELLGVVIGECRDCLWPQPAPEIEATSVQLHQSIGVAGVWCLCWYDIPRIAKQVAPGVVRQVLAELVLREAADERHCSELAPLFVPVIVGNEDVHEVWAHFRAMQSRHDNWSLNRTVFVNDAGRGGVVAYEVADPALTRAPHRIDARRIMHHNGSVHARMWGPATKD